MFGAHADIASVSDSDKAISDETRSQSDEQSPQVCKDGFGSSQTQQLIWLSDMSSKCS